MSGRWFRWYEGTAEDGKLRLVAREAGVSVAVVVAVWAALLEDASRGAHGDVTAQNGGQRLVTARNGAARYAARSVTNRNVAYYSAILDLDQQEIGRVLAAMVNVGMLTPRPDEDGYVVTRWRERQFEGDVRDPTNADRQRRHRARQRKAPQQERGSEREDRNGGVTAAARPESREQIADESSLRSDSSAPGGATKNSVISVLATVLDEVRAREVTAHRNRLRKPLTIHAAKLLAGKLAEAPDPNVAADEMIARGWQSFDARWLEQTHAQRPPTARSPRRESYADIVLELENDQGEAHDQGAVARNRGPRRA